MKRALFFAVALTAIFFSCAKKQVPEDVLIKVGDRVVTQKEFLYRAEFTPHPNFPAHDRNLEKIMLNNMIYEKLFALERGDESELANSERFQDYLKGIKEQTMRERLFYKKAFDVVKLDSAEIAKRYRLSQREYDLEFYTINNDSMARALRDRMQAQPDSRNEIFDNIMPDQERPSWSVKWKDPDHVRIHEALYSGPLAQDSVIGPIPLNYDQWIVMKVVDWKDVLIFGGEEQQLRVNEVVEKTTMNKATQNWDAYTREIMSGKEIQFDPDVFVKLADLIFNLETAADQAEKSQVMQRFWQEEDSTLTVADIPTEEAFLQQPFFTIDGETWTVGDFRKALASHPLVYRKSANGRGEFYKVFRIAVADLLRDWYLNKEAYAMGLDKDMEVQRRVEMWGDAMVASYERNQVLKELGEADPDTTDPYRQQRLRKAFDAYLEELRNKYNEEIYVDLDTFNDIEFNKTQLFVTQQSVPYPIAVPSWPQFSTENSVDFQPLE